MAQPQPKRPPNATPNSKKRKDHPFNPHAESNKRARNDHRPKRLDSRTILSQTSSKALNNGELDVEKFVKARQYEIKALEDGISRSRKALNTRAFQHVPKELRRRTASHNVKRVPKRLQTRVRREMIEDNTPTVTPKKRKPTRHMRLRIESAKKLRALGAQSRAAKQKDAADKVNVRPSEPATEQALTAIRPAKGRNPKLKTASLASPPVPKAKFRKRQANKTWLPTHMFHAKRARMTPPKEPLWKFAIPLTPTAKCYRPVHRSANEKGAVAWDVSYTATIRLEGQQRSIEGVLKSLGVGSHGDHDLWTRRGDKWRDGTRTWQGLLYERECPDQAMAPACIIWCVEPPKQSARPNDDLLRHKRILFIRLHPSAFAQVWTEVVRLSKIVKPQIAVEDLRFEVGSIEITGPAATEVLQSALWPSPYPPNTDKIAGSVGECWKTLAGLTSQKMLPPNILLAFDVQDPRLHHPPRTISLPNTAEAQSRLMQTLVAWPIDSQQDASPLFERKARLAASSALPSQKAINRRKALANPGEFPETSPKDPRIPVVLYSSSNRETQEATWSVLLPWRCVQPVWYSLIYYPLSTGGQTRFGGMDEKRQICFEKGKPWFPGDFPGTEAGWAWELHQRVKLQDAWLRKPKSKRVNWDAVHLGPGRKGEIGAGWACHWERLLQATSKSTEAPSAEADDKQTEIVDQREHEEFAMVKPRCLVHLTPGEARDAVNTLSSLSPMPNKLAIVRLDLLTRGVPQSCARIYRLPTATSDANLRQRWLDLHPQNQAQGRPRSRKHALPQLPKDAPVHVMRQQLAKSLLTPPRPGETGYPPCPAEEDLIGFVTSGNFNLGEGQGTGVGSILLQRVIAAGRRDTEGGNLCIVRNAGNDVGRLAKWEIVPHC